MITLLAWAAAMVFSTTLSANAQQMGGQPPSDLPLQVESKITPKTRAIIAVHLAGNACDMRAMKGIADKLGL